MSDAALFDAGPLSLRARLFRRAVKVLIQPIFARADLSVEQRRQKLLRLTQATQITIPRGSHFESAPLGGIDAEWTRPAGAVRGTLLYLHGGAYVIGAPRVYRELTSRLAREARVRVATIDYRLAPEHPFPAAVDDAVSAYRALLDAEGAERLVIAGDSAGGGLTLACLLRLRDEGLPMPAAAAILSPWGDVTCSLPAMTAEAWREPILNVEALRECGRMYAGDTPADHPQLSPVHADLGGLPPLLIQGTDAEVLADDARQLFAHAQAAGVDVTLEMWPGLWHVWQLFAGLVPEADAATRRLGAFLGRHLP
ncbi:alpha/beta hydrolase [Flagellatimonas centrodinii]|uniref:alpha/beta hydrolase n=1 Tax=Flagellatimonas centrodinii TaxID=2806210 RepID=UPI001FEFD43E|nr:alpha/beta hydrolase [Flagellatimonas centrodinii]ULQ45250.1 alpha/beta hydrolase [Flagellatimonas centrodinii]